MTRTQQGRDLLTLVQAAARLGVAAATLRAQIHRGRLEARKLGRDWLVGEAAIARYERDVRRKAG